MSSLDYSQRIGGKGQARGLPVRTGSHYYEKDPEDKYQNVVSLGTTNTDQHHLSRFVYRKLPHLPVTYTKTPYFNNPDAPNSGNLSRPRYMVIKRGQFLMVAEDDQPSIGLFVDGGTASVEDKTYMDPEDLATSGRIVGFTRGDGTRYKLDPEDGSTAGSDPDDVITQAEYDNLADTSDDTATDQDDYVAITADSPLSIDRFQALTDEEQEGFTAVYEGTTDDNDRIATGGTNLYAEVESAYFNETDKAVNVEVDVDGFYFGGGTSSHGFVFPSSGGADRTLFYNEVDKKARVTLPSNGADESRVVEPIGNVSDVSAANIAEYVNSAAYLEARPTSGFAHTDREQALSKHWHGFTTGTEAIQPAQKGRLRIPFVDISKLQTIVQNRTDLTWGDDFNFAATSDDRSGVKVYRGPDLRVGLDGPFGLGLVDIDPATHLLDHHVPVFVDRRDQLVHLLFRHVVEAPAVPGSVPELQKLQSQVVVAAILDYISETVERFEVGVNGTLRNAERSSDLGDGCAIVLQQVLDDVERHRGCPDRSRPQSPFFAHGDGIRTGTV